MKRMTAARVKIPSVTRPRRRSATVMRVNPATRLRGDMTRWMIPRSFGVNLGVNGVNALNAPVLGESGLWRASWVWLMYQPSPRRGEKATSNPKKRVRRVAGMRWVARSTTPVFTFRQLLGTLLLCRFYVRHARPRGWEVSA